MTKVQLENKPDQSDCCKCGYDLTHPWVVETVEYTLWGWLLIAFSISALPKAVVTKCHKCGHVFSRGVDMADRQAARYR